MITRRQFGKLAVASAIVPFLPRLTKAQTVTRSQPGPCVLKRLPFPSNAAFAFDMPRTNTISRAMALWECRAQPLKGWCFTV
jgi:hypothetical protein